MKNELKKFLAVFLAAIMLLSGCGYGSGLDVNAEIPTNFSEASTPPELPTRSTGSGEENCNPVAFRDMVFTAPDIRLLENALITVQNLPADSDPEAVMEHVDAFFDIYADMLTNCNFAYIHYCMDISNSEWDNAYTDAENAMLQADATREELLRYLASSQYREALEADDQYFGINFFDEYDGEALWDDEFMELNNRESELISQYYDILASAYNNPQCSDSNYYYTIYGKKLANVYLELVKLRQKIGKYAGYDNYTDYAYAEMFGRNYTPEQAYAYTQQIAQELAPLYRDVMKEVSWLAPGRKPVTSEECLDYVRTVSKKMGGLTEEAFNVMTACGVYDIEPGSKKYNASFCTYLDTYNVPFVFVNPVGNQYDKLTLIHEFGHFTAAYSALGNYAGMDVAEVFSQALEYLSLVYGTDTSELTQMKMVDCLQIYVEQAAFSAFEYRVFSENPDTLTREKISEIYLDVLQEFGLDIYSVHEYAYTDISHFFNSPHYVLSYVVSNDLALQIYQAERNLSGKGATLFEKFASTDSANIVDLAEGMGLQSPFDSRRLSEVKKLLESIV